MAALLSAATPSFRRGALSGAVSPWGPVAPPPRSAPRTPGSNEETLAAVAATGASALALAAGCYQRRHGAGRRATVVAVAVTAATPAASDPAATPASPSVWSRRALLASAAAVAWPAPRARAEEQTRPAEAELPDMPERLTIAGDERFMQEMDEEMKEDRPYARIAQIGRRGKELAEFRKRFEILVRRAQGNDAAGLGGSLEGPYTAAVQKQYRERGRNLLKRVRLAGVQTYQDMEVLGGKEAMPRMKKLILGMDVAINVVDKAVQTAVWAPKTDPETGLYFICGDVSRGIEQVQQLNKEMRELTIEALGIIPFEEDLR